MNELSVSTRETEDVVVICPMGFINAHNVRGFEEALSQAMQRKRYKIIVNCAGLAYIASAGLGALMGAIEEIRANEGDLRLTDLNETILNIFEILGFTRLYRIFDSEAEALRSFRAEGDTVR